MQYNDWQTLFDEYRAFDKKNRQNSLESAFAEEVANLWAHQFSSQSIQCSRLMRLVAEYHWIKDGKPYYNVHPRMCSTLSKTNLDKIPCKFIETLFSATLFKFSDKLEERFGENGVTISMAPELYEAQIGFKSALFFKLDITDEIAKKALGKYLSKLKEDESHFLVFVDEGFRNSEQRTVEGKPLKRTLINSVLISVGKEETIPEALERNFKNQKDEVVKAMLMSVSDRMEKLFRVMITAGFLADSPDEGLIVPDILSKDLPNYQDAIRRKDSKAIDTIVDRAIRRRGSKGWNLGTNEMFVGEAKRLSQRTSSGEGKELDYSHIRGGHPHAVRYGEGKEKVKIKWYRPSRVRKDLPFREDDET